MERFLGKVAVVTGSSSGIGKALSKELVKHGLIVVGLARRMEKLQELSQELLKDSSTYTGKFHAMECDVSQEKEIIHVFSKIKTSIGPIWILVNNAGHLLKHDIELLKIEGKDFDETFNTNTRGLLLCTKEAMNQMIDNSIAGHIINISSIGGLPEFKIDLGNLYTTSKKAVRALSDALRRESTAKKANIKVTCINPGTVITEFGKQMGITYQGDAETELKAEDVASACISVINTPPNVLISELTVVPIYQRYF